MNDLRDFYIGGWLDNGLLRRPDINLGRAASTAKASVLAGLASLGLAVSAAVALPKTVTVHASAASSLWVGSSVEARAVAEVQALQVSLAARVSSLFNADDSDVDRDLLSLAEQAVMAVKSRGQAV